MKLVIAIPAYNEAVLLTQTINQLVDFCQKNLTLDWQIVIANNGSTDQTATIAEALSAGYSRVVLVNTVDRGKGAAIRAAWQAVAADIYGFMDADLATDLAALPPATAAVVAGADLAIGSRFHPLAEVQRNWLRRLVSWFYHFLIHYVCGFRVADAACGFKFISQAAWQELGPTIIDRQWFFDSELVLTADRQGYKITEIPVRWHEPRGPSGVSRVKIVAVSWAYLVKVFQLLRRLKKFHH